MIIILAIIGLVLFDFILVWPLCAMSSRISRLEEQAEEKEEDL